MHEPRRLPILLFSAVLATACHASKTQHPVGAAGQDGAAGSAGATAGVSGGAGQTSQAGAGGTAQGGSGGSAPEGGAGTGSLPDAAEDTAGDASISTDSADATVGTGCKGATVCYDFEACATPTGWTVAKNGGNQGAGSTLVDNVMAHTGTCALHMKDFNGDSPQHAFLGPLPANFGSLLWGRAWVFNTSAPTNHGALIKARYAIANKADQDWYEVGYELKNYNGQWHNPLPPSGLPEWILRSSTPVATGRWQCVEWLWDAGNGGMAQAADPRMWVDGKEITFGPGLQYNGDGTNTVPQRPTTPSGTNFVSIEVGLTMYHLVDEKMDVFIDDLAFGKQRVGCEP